MEKIRIGVLGCGEVAQMRHLPVYEKLKDSVDVVALCDLNKKLAIKTAMNYDIPSAYDEAHKMLSDQSLDVIDVCTPPQTHKELANLAMSHGCHVIVEKPMAVRTSDCDSMIRTAHEYDVKLSVIHQMLFHPPMRKARRLVKEGKLGKFVGMEIHFHEPKYIHQQNHWVHRLPGGIIGETGPHTVYLSIPFVGHVNSVKLYAEHFEEYPWSPFGEYSIFLNGERGFSRISVSYTSTRLGGWVVLMGSNSSLLIDLLGMSAHPLNEINLKPVSIAKDRIKLATSIVRGVLSNAVKVLTHRTKLGHEWIIEKFISSIRQGTEVPVPPEKGRENVRVMEMIVSELRRKYENS